MKNTWWAMGGLLLLAAPAQAQLNQQWLEFRNETSTRLTAAAGLGASDPEEKDYAWGDVNRDGWIDLVVVRKQPFTTAGRRPNVLFMNENGVLVDRTSQFAAESDVGGDQGFLTATNDRDVVLADFNNDGWLDIATAVTISDVPLPVQPKHISHPRIYMNKGAPAGVWQGFRFEAGRSPQLYVLQASGQPDLAQPYPGRFCSIAAGDVDNDGDQDLFLGDYDAGSSDAEPAGKDLNDRLWLNDGTGVFTDSYRSRMTTNMLSSAFSTAAVIADMNGDGAMDIVKDSGLNPDVVGPQSVRIAYNLPANPQSFDLLQANAHLFAPYFVSVGDLNNDSKLDMVVTDDTADRYRLNTGNDGLTQVVWGPATGFTFASTAGDDGFGSQSAIVDLDQDGWKDVLISDVDVDDPTGSGGTGTGCPGAASARRLHIYRNQGNAPNVTFREEAQALTATGWKGAVGLNISDLRGTYHTAPFDIDRDGDDDLVIGRTCSTSVWMNLSRSRFGTALDNSTGEPARIFASGLVAANSTNLVVRAAGVPPSAKGAFVVSAVKQDPCVPEGNGLRCIGEPGARFLTLGRANADAQGEVSLNVSLTTGPLAGIAPGSLRYVQYRFVDPAGGANASDGLELRFRP